MITLIPPPYNPYRRRNKSVYVKVEALRVLSSLYPHIVCAMKRTSEKNRKLIQLYCVTNMARP